MVGVLALDEVLVVGGVNSIAYELGHYTKELPEYAITVNVLKSFEQHLSHLR